MDVVTYWLYRLVSAAIGRLPLGLGIRLGRALGLTGYFLLPRYRGITLRNLAIAFPELPAGDRRRIGRRHFATLVGNLFAAEKIARMPAERIQGLVEIEGMEHIRPLMERNRGLLMVVSHIGNWELLAQLSPGVYGRPCGAVFQRLGNALIDAHIRRTRGRLGLELFDRREGFGKAAEMLSAGGGVGVLIDQHAGDAGVWCPFFGRLASTSPLAATLALRTGAALIPAAMYTNGIGRWRAVIDPPIDSGSSDSDEITARLNLALEQQIRRHPEDWFWVHRRWKTPTPRFLLAKYKRGIVVAPSGESPPDATAGELFAFAARKHAPQPALKPFRILIRSSNWLGDAVMSIPAVRAIKRGRPDAHVTILTQEKLVAVWRLVPEVDDIIPVAPPRGTGLLRTLAGAIQVFQVGARLRGRGFDAAVILPNSLRSALEPWIGRIPRRVGYPGHSPRGLFLNQIYRDTSTPPGSTVTGPREHQVRHYLKLAEFIGARIGVEENHGFPVPGAECRPPAAPPFRIAVCAGAEYGPAKRWLPERFAEVIRIVGEGSACQWHLVGTAKDSPVAEEIASKAGHPPNVENHCGKTTLEELIALLRGCHVLLTNDTGTMHLASVLGLRTVAIFGSTEPSLTGPLGAGHVVLRRQVECSPCFLRECPIDFRCMKAIEAPEVAAAVRSVIGLRAGEKPPAPR
ncbi:MAG: glycosyltransferase family 9 protein [Chthoniobacteraceae bacterium]